MSELLTPCVKRCKLEHGRCSGCNRTLEQIKNWRTYSRSTKLKITEEIKMPQLTESQNERLLIVSDKASNAQHYVNEVLRHGYTADDRLALEEALGDLLEAAGRLAEKGDISWTKVIERVQSH